jgi:hypothetical protein
VAFVRADGAVNARTSAAFTSCFLFLLLSSVSTFLERLCNILLQAHKSAIIKLPPYAHQNSSFLM